MHTNRDREIARFSARLDFIFQNVYGATQAPLFFLTLLFIFDQIDRTSGKTGYCDGFGRTYAIPVPDVFAEVERGRRDQTDRRRALFIHSMWRSRLINHDDEITFGPTRDSGFGFGRRRVFQPPRVTRHAEGEINILSRIPRAEIV